MIPHRVLYLPRGLLSTLPMLGARSFLIGAVLFVGVPSLYSLNPSSAPTIVNTKNASSPGQVAQSVRVLPQYTKVVGMIPGQGTYKRQPLNA